MAVKNFSIWLIPGVILSLGLIIWAAVSGGMDCPKGQQVGIVYWVPRYSTITRMTTIQPVYGCVSNG